MRSAKEKISKEAVVPGTKKKDVSLGGREHWGLLEQLTIPSFYKNASFPSRILLRRRSYRQGEMATQRKVLQIREGETI